MHRSSWRARHLRIHLDRTRVMGVVNVTPDSFSDGGRHATTDAAVAHGRRLAEEGADVLDVGGESTRPGAPAVSAAEEAARVVPVVERLVKEVAVPVSVDTMKAEVAEAALAAGAAIVNDVTAGEDPAMFRVVARADAGLVLMHMRGDPRTMHEHVEYGDVVGEVRAHLRERVAAARAAGVGDSAIVVDPGIGFAKTAEQNVEILRRLREIADDGHPVLVGASRKSFIGRLTATEDGAPPPPPTDRLEGTIAAHTLAAANGASIVRVHDVRAGVRAARVADAILGRGERRG